MTETLTQSRLKELLTYYPESGEFFWNRTRPGVNKDAPVGTKSNGYLRVSVDGRRIMAHRLAWLYMTGEMPPEFIDHINRNGMDNRFSNLRLASRSENAQNTRGKGVHFNSRIQKYISQISVGPVGSRDVRYLGCFQSKDEARAAYLSAKQSLHPFYSGEQ